MGEIVNLRRARKDRERLHREDEAAANRVKFGRSKAEKATTRAEDELAARRLDGHRLYGAADSGEPEA